MKEFKLENYNWPDEKIPTFIESAKLILKNEGCEAHTPRCIDCPFCSDFEKENRHCDTIINWRAEPFDLTHFRHSLTITTRIINPIRTLRMAQNRFISIIWIMLTFGTNAWIVDDLRSVILIVDVRSNK